MGTGLPGTGTGPTGTEAWAAGTEPGPAGMGTGLRRHGHAEFAAPARTAGRQARPRRRHLGLWAVAALVVGLTSATLIAVALTSHSRTSGRVTTSSSSATPGPRAVVLAYIAAINARNWHRVWALGGKNLSTSYQDMMAGYRLTAHDELTSIKVHGDTVQAHLLAHQTTGAVHSYRMRYVVHGGVITAGRRSYWERARVYGKKK